MSHLVIAPVLLPLLMGIVLLLLRRQGVRLRRSLSVAAALGQVGLALALMAAVGGGEILVYALGNWPSPYGIVLVADRLAVWMLLITALLAFFALLYALRGTDLTGRHFHVLFQWQLFGLNGAFLTGDLFNLFVFFEILLLASYGLLLHGSGRQRTRAGLHFVVINLAGSTLFLFAVGTLYGVLGTLNMADLARQVAAVPPENAALVRAAGLLLFGVFALKAALLPLYLWLPAAYAATSAPVAALFAIMTKVGAYGILRVYTLIFGAEAGLATNLVEPWLLPLALLTLAVGMLGVVAAPTLRLQVAYLVVASIGTLLAAFGLDSGAGIAAGLYYLPHTTFAAAAFFLLADSIARRRGELADRLEPGTAIASPRLFGSLFFMCAILMVGLPPLSGFLGKFLLLRAALAHVGGYWVMGVVLVTGLLGMIALVRSGSLLFYRVHLQHDDHVQAPVRAGEMIPILGLLSLGLALTLWAGPVTDYARATAAQLLHPDAYIHAVLGAGAALMGRLLPHLLLTPALAVVWLLLVNSLAPGHLLLGLLLGWLIPLFTLRFWPEKVHVYKPLALLRFAAVVLLDIVLANLTVARLILGRPGNLRPAFVVVPLALRSDLAISLLANTITLTPGTVSALLSPDRTSLLVHALDVADAEVLVASIKRRYETPLKEVFEAC